MNSPTLFCAALAAALALFPVSPAAAQICTPDFCEIPIDEISKTVEAVPVTARAHGYMSAKDFAAFLRENAFGDAAAQRKGGREHGEGQDESFPWHLAAAFLAGLLLNLSPCVLPLLPIQLAILGMGARAQSRRDGAMRGAVYGLSMALAYGIVGFAVVRSGAIFGSLQSTRPFNAAMALLFVLLALAMLGVFSIDFSSGRRPVHGSIPLAGVALAGAGAAILAGACVAPAVLGAMLYAAGAYAAGNHAALALPLVLGLGMAAPWPLIGAGLAILPRPGRWMVAVKWLFAAMAVGFAVRYALLALPARRPAAEGAIDYHDFDAAYAKVEKSRKPVVIDFFSSWCGSCSTMEKTTFRDPAVQALLGKCEFLRVQVEDPLEDDAMALLARFGVRGSPAIVLIANRP